MMHVTGGPLAERDPNISGRTSRASNFSNGSKGGQGQRRPSNPQPHQHAGGAHHSNRLDLSVAPGVMGMLRTTMEIGDVGSLAIASGRNSGFHRGPNRRSGNTSRMSTGSAPSQTGQRNSRHQNWPSMSSAGPHRSITSNLTAPPFLEQMQPGLPGAADSPSTPRQHDYMLDAGGPRSFSLTYTTTPPFGFANHRSFTSLRSNEAYAPRNNEPFPRPKSPYRYPTRLKRPGYRPSSPALSDVTGLQPSRFQHQHQQVQHYQNQGGSRLRPLQGQSNGHRHGNGHSGQLPPTPRRQQPYPTHRSRSGPPAATLSAGPHAGGPYPPRGDDSPSMTDHSLYNSNNGGNVYKRAGSIYSRSSRSNISATPSPDPPTPRDVAAAPGTLQIVSDVRTVAAVHVQSIAAKSKGPVYYDYSEDYYNDLEKEVTEVFTETLPDSPMPIGFVQRIKALLEEREKALGHESDRPSTPRKSQIDLSIPIPDMAELPATPVARRITREMILAVMSPSSGVDLGLDSSIEAQADDFTSAPVADGFLAPSPVESTPALTEDGGSPKSHAKSVSKDSGSVYSNKSSGSKTGTTTGEVMELAMRYDQPTTEHSMTADDETSEFSIPAPPAPASVLQVHAAVPIILQPVTLPIVVVDANEPVADKIKRHWSIRRAAAGPLRAQSAYVPGTVPRGSLTSVTVPPRQSSWPLAELEAHPKVEKDDHGPVKTKSGPLIVAPLFSPAPPVMGSKEYVEDTTCSPVSPSEAESVSHVNQTSLFSPLNTSELHSSAPRSSISTAHLSTRWSYRRPVPSSSVASVPITEITSLKPTAGPDSTTGTDTRFSMHRSVHSAQGPLADVKEEPGLESSMDLRNSTFKFPIARIGAVKIPFEENRLSKEVRESKGSKHSKVSMASKDSSKVSKLSKDSRERRRHSSSDIPSNMETLPRATSSVFKPSSSGLSDARAIPSMNFSNINLLARLNEALEIRRASLGSEFEDLAISEPTPELHVSSGVMREKYRSFFKTLDDMTGAHIENDVEAEVDADGEGENGLDTDAEPRASRIEKACEESAEAYVIPTLRPMSPDELMEEVNRISVPSVTALTQRLSELLPSLKRYFGDTGNGDAVVFERDPLGETIREIRGLGGSIPMEVGDCVEGVQDGEDGEDGWRASRPKTVEVDNEEMLNAEDHGQVKMKGKSKVKAKVREWERPLSEEGNCVVLKLNTNDNDKYNDNDNDNDNDEDKDKDSNLHHLAPIPPSRSRSDSYSRSRSPVLNSSISTPRPFSVPPVGVAELEGSLPTTHRLRSLSDSQVDSSILERIGRLSRSSQPSLRSSPVDPRPWNHDSNYPWSVAMPAIDIEFPSSALRRDGIGQRPSKLRLRVSGSDLSVSENVTSLSDNTVPTSPLASKAAVASGSETTSAVVTRRKASKRSVIGSFSRKILHSSPGNSLNVASANGSSSVAGPVDHSGFLNGPDILRGEERAVDPGDRYPTTGLSPPSNLMNMDEVQSFFSDDSSVTARNRHAAKRARGSSFKRRLTTGLRGRLAGNHQSRTPRDRSRPATACDRQTRDVPLASGASLIVPDRQGATSAGAAGMSRAEFRAKKLVERLKVLIWRGGEFLWTMSGRRKKHHECDGTDEGWSEIGASGMDLFEAPAYDAGATAMSTGVGVRHDSCGGAAVAETAAIGKETT